MFLQLECTFGKILSVFEQVHTFLLHFAAVYHLFIILVSADLKGAYIHKQEMACDSKSKLDECTRYSIFLLESNFASMVTRSGIHTGGGGGGGGGGWWDFPPFENPPPDIDKLPCPDISISDHSLTIKLKSYMKHKVILSLFHQQIQLFWLTSKNTSIIMLQKYCINYKDISLPH